MSAPAAPSPAGTQTIPSTPSSVLLEAPQNEKGASALSVGSWALYDFANTIFSLNVISSYFPLFIIELGFRDSDYAFPMSLATLVVAVLMPLLGSLSDRGGKRIPWLIGFTMLSVVMTAVMGFTHDFWTLIIAFVLASIGYQTASVFYDALLPSVSTTLNWGKVSGLGVGLGYVGSLFGLSVATVIVGKNSSQTAFLPTAALFLLFALPCFFFVRDRAASWQRDVKAERLTVRGSLSTTWRTLNETRMVPGLSIFLIANFLYSDALNTVIVAMTVYSTRVVGFKSPLEVLGPAIIAAVLGSWLFGLVTDWLTSKQSLIISLLMWVAVFVGAIFVLDKVLFQWVIAPLAGIALGSTWTAARTMMIELSPPEKLGQFMGIYNLTGKFSAVLGPLVWGVTLSLLPPDTYGQFAYQVAIASLLVMVLLGFVLHLFTPNIKRTKRAAAPEPAS